MARVRNLKDFKKLKQKNALKEFQHEGSVPTKINNAVSVDEVALTGATAKVKEFEHEGSVAVVTKSQDDGDEQKIFKRQLIENPLHKFATVNHVITLAVLDAQEINFTGLVVRNGPKYPVAQTAGRVGRDPTAFGQIGLNLELLIDNLTVDAVVSPTPQNRQAQATNISFDVVEPYHYIFSSNESTGD